MTGSGVPLEAGDTVAMRVRLHHEPDTFSAAADPFFLSDPFSANVIAVVLARVAAGDPIGGPNRLWATVEDDDGAVLGVAMHTPPHALFVSRMPDEAAEALADALVDAERELPGVNGACESTTAFAAVWSGQTGQTSTIVTATRMYRLEELRRPRNVPGEGNLATVHSDVELVSGWVASFHDEARPNAPHDPWVMFERRIAAGQVHLWRDRGTAVSMAAVSTASAGVARVGPVYTPASARRSGYGAAVTAEATAAAIAAGAHHVVLYTDRANPTSNSIYRAIGYRPHHDAEERSFQ